MMSNKPAIVLSLILLFFQTAQASEQNMDFMRSIGKIYVVVAVIIATFIGLAIFLIHIDRKITRIEKELQ